MLEPRRIKAISLDLDDTLWPIWPTIERAEQVLHAWLADHAPATAALHDSPHALRAIREEVGTLRPDLRHDLSGLRRESIRLALARSGDDPVLAEAAFEAFFAARQQVTLFPDALRGLEFLCARYPLVSVSNGNADLQRTGLAPYFRGALSAASFGVGKPDARIFHAAASLLGVAPEQVLHVGDDTVLDVLGAQDAGLQAAWANRNEAMWPHEGRAADITFLDFDELCDALG